MNPLLRELLESLGLDASATDAEALRFLDALHGPERRLAEAYAGHSVGLSSPAAMAAGGVEVDRAEGVIRNISMISTGEALGHGFEIDARTLGTIVEAFHANRDGVKSRLSHPELNFVGTRDGAEVLVGRPRNLRVEGDRVRGDIYLANFAAKSPSGDLREYLLSVAEEDPGIVGVSVVAGFDYERRFDPDSGEEFSPVARAKFLKAVDFTDDPAANRSGLLTTPRMGSPRKLGETKPKHPTEGSEMNLNKKLRAYLEQCGLSREATDKQALRFWAMLGGKQRTKARELSSEADRKLLSGADEMADDADAESDDGDRHRPDTEDRARQGAGDREASEAPAEAGATAASRPRPRGAETRLTAEAVERTIERRLSEDRRRRTQLANLAAATGLSDAWVEKQYERGTGIDRARELAIEHMGTADAPIPGLSGHVRGGSDGRESFAAGLEDALALRGGSVVEEPHERAREFLGLSMIEIARKHLGVLGVDTAGMSRVRVAKLAMSRAQLSAHGVGATALAHATGDFPLILANSLRKRLRDAYEEQESTWNLWASRTTVPDFKEIKRPILGGVPTPPRVLEGAEYTFATVGEAQEAYAVAKYGQLIAFTWEMLVNDDLMAFSRRAMRFGAATRRLEDDLVYAQITDNPVMAETGNTLFHSGHGNLAGTGAAPSISSLRDGRTAMRLQKGIKPDANTEGPTLALRPRFMLVPAELETEAEQLVSSLVDPTKSNNYPNAAFIRTLTPIGVPSLSDDSATAWYLAANAGQVDTVEVAFLEGEPAPFIDEEEGFAVDGRTFKMRHVVAAHAMDYRGLYKNPGA